MKAGQQLKKISGYIFDPVSESEPFPGEITIDAGRIQSIERLRSTTSVPQQCIVPPLIDSHGHVESSMLTPSRFAEASLRHGTLGFMADPHEIANVLGIPGIDWMIEAGRNAPYLFAWGAPSCVPASGLEDSGAIIGPEDFELLLRREEITHGAEFMNFPGVISGDPDMLAKLAACKRVGKPIDGHAPGVRKDAIRDYIAAGPNTNHECFSYEEGLENIQANGYVSIREGSAARNFHALIPLLDEYPERCMFSCDDIHPDTLTQRGQVNWHVRTALQMGIAAKKVFQAASINPIRHYRVPVGLLQVGDHADFVVVSDLKEFEVKAAVVRGVVAFDGTDCSFSHPPVQIVNQFNREELSLSDLRVPAEGTKIRVIDWTDGQLYSTQSIEEATVVGGFAESDIARDILKVAVIDRYHPKAKPAIAFIRGFNLKRGALALSVMHDGHHVGVLGCSDEEMLRAANSIIRAKGGLAVCEGENIHMLSLPIAGLMVDSPAKDVASQYAALDAAAKRLGCTLQSPFISASFMGLTVIPELKLGNRGLVLGSQSAVSLWVS